MTSQEAAAAATSTGSPAQEYIVRVPKLDKKKYNVLKFNSSLNVDFTKWSQVKMERENNFKDIKIEDDMPKFGAGSEYGRDVREEARKKKYGVVAKKYNIDDQPWLLRINGKSGKRYRGIKEGGVTENASYYVFTQAPDGAFEAFPINEWYNFTPVQTYKTLNAEEAEEEFGRRDKVYNYFSIMLKKRLKNDENAADGESEEIKKEAKKKRKGTGDLKITELEDWINSSDDDDDDDEEKDDDEQRKAKPKGNKKGQQQKNKKKKKKDEDDDEAWEDSDDGDEEGREVDYISDESSGSDEEPEAKDKDALKGVEDEEAIRKMENSESDEEEEGEGNKDNGEDGRDETAAPNKTDKNSQKDKKEKKDGGSSSDTSEDTSDSDDFDNDAFHSAMFMPGSSSKKAQKKARKEGSNQNSASVSRSNTPTKAIDKLPTEYKGIKRQMETESKEQVTKKPRIDLPSSSQSFEGISEDAIRRYLMRKPMTASELLQKFKSKKTGLSSDQMVNTITQILKRLNPDKQTVKGKMYLSIKQS